MKSEITFKEEILGHKRIVNFLDNAVSRKKISHAYLFIGPEGIGKKMIALHFIKQILKSRNYPKFNYSAQTFEEILAGNTDIHFVSKKEDKNRISIEQVRELIHKLNLKNFRSPYKFAVIEQAELLGREASNSFLKTLEEPTKNTVIILITSQENLIPDTVKSRCQTIRFNLVEQSEIFSYLKKIKVSPTLARNLTLLSQGKPGLALDFARNNEFYENYRQKVDNFFQLFNSNIPKKFSIISSLKSEFNKNEISQQEIEKTLTIWLSVLRDMMLLKINSTKHIIHRSKNNNYKNIIKNKSITYFTNLIRHLTFSINLIKGNLNRNLVLENFVLKI